MKVWWKSKLFWTGIAQIGLSLVEYLQTQDWTDWEAINWTGVVLGALTIVFRWLTTEPITSFNPKFDKLRPRVMQKITEQK